MDFAAAFKKNKHSRKISPVVGDGDDIYHERRPVLSDHHRHDDDDDNHNHSKVMVVSDNELREVIVEIDGGDDRNKIWRKTSYDFWKDDDGDSVERGGGREEGFYCRQRRELMAGEDPPLDTDELRRDHTRKSPPLTESPVHNNNGNNHHNRVSMSNMIDIENEKTSKHDAEEEEVDSQQFQNPQRPPSFASEVDDGGGEVLRCTSYQRRQSMLRSKAKSRLIDQPELDPKTRKALNPGQLRSEMLRRASGMLCKPPEEEEDDPLFDEDIPEKYKRANLNAITILQWVSLLVIVAALICSLSHPKLKGRKFRGLHWWKWEVLVLVLICGRLVSGWGIRALVFFIERNFLLRKRVLYFVYGVRNAVQNCIWLGLVLIAWHYLFHKKVQRETNIKFLLFVNKVLVCFLVGALLWLVKTLIVKVLASSFHVSTFFDRIQESLFNQYVIETLSGPPLIEIKNIQDEEERSMAELWTLQNAGATISPEHGATAFSSAKSGRVMGSGGLQKQQTIEFQKTSRETSKKQCEGKLIDRLRKQNPKNISAWNMKRLIKIVRHGVVSTLDEQILESINGDEYTTKIKSEFEEKVAARKIFQNVARRGSKFIYMEDVLRFMLEDEALKAISLLGGSPESEKISKSSLKSWVVNAFREQSVLALTLNDTKTAVNKLHKMVNGLVSIIIVVVCLHILEIVTSKFLMFMSSQVVIVAFIFGNSCKTVFEAIIFLFVMHPFDVGDWCEIDGVQMIVEEMNILNTIFLRCDNQKIIYPNSTLSTKPISNYYRSPDMGDSIDFCVHIATPTEKIATIKQRIISYIENKKDHWYPSPMVVLMDLEELNKLKMSVWLRHRMNHQDMGEKWTRRALVIEEMVKIFKELDIEFRLHPIDINIRSMPPISSTRYPNHDDQCEV